MPDALTLIKKSNFYQDIVIKFLSKMVNGQLYLTLHDGQSITIGDGKDALRANITVNNEEFYKRCILFGDIGFGEAYVDGLWDTDNITNVIKWVLLNIENAPNLSGSKAQAAGLNLLKMYNKLVHFKRANTVEGSKKNISAHYDLNNDFFASFLDPTMTYSSAYFYKDGISLEEAQLAKYERLCKQLRLKPTDHVLEIGSGWGGNAIYIAKNYGCKVTSLTISEEQAKLARERVTEAGLDGKVEILLKDYRELDGTYDKIVSIEMLEAVGDAFLDVYFRQVNSLLKKNGLLAIQVITSPDSRYESLKKGVDWIQKHIFPGSLLPSVAAINGAINRTSDMTLVDLKDLGLHYAETLRLWFVQFNANLTKAKKLGFDDTFVRKWNYYLCYCEAAFAMRNINVMHLVYTRPNNLEW
ncbi:cyclopropane-fatty-acyl-phospholipid synthase family protein [uncultured Mucilaginibacter sp.]|uniref:SAM-dependent methyltransferase n=1 Tax=uncultured Mucilaginibacter sp. TaxID=797541 RepID=UPI0025E60E3B|nr:cyclopropane-fatty-acyl-phospholipid synthase family protein [uncultured Mucilaginibacter sp.]